MIRVRITLLRQIKVKQVYTSEQLATLRTFCSKPEWEAFQGSYHLDYRRTVLALDRHREGLE
jgi:hypothetical protein